ncbi:MAG TPA: pyruvate kinase [bacterium]|nr:pyruvate kinase [bacterium]
MRRTKIVCTIGPASSTIDLVKQLLMEGMDVARLNFSHGDHATHKQHLNTLKAAAEQLGRPLAIMLDTKGPEIRLGTFADGQVALEEGDIFTFTTYPITGDKTRVQVQYQQLPQDVHCGQIILLDDGTISMEILEVTDTEVRCQVLNAGILRDRKKLNLPGCSLSLPALSDQDMADIAFGIKCGIDFIAASYIRNADNILEIRKLLEQFNADTPIIAKIESGEGIKNIDAILKLADGVMVARGDLGVEIPAEEVPLLQKMIIKKANRLGKPVITATQMLESMISSPQPTRAEASDVANAILDGSDAVMLSAETATGRYPLEAVSYMARIAKRTEMALLEGQNHRSQPLNQGVSVTDAISYATYTAARALEAAAILVSTSSGHTARMVAKNRPVAPIIAATSSEYVQRQLLLVWGVYPILIKATANTDQMIETVIQGALDHGYIQSGDLVIITAGVPAGVPGSTNLIKIQTVGSIITRGTGLGNVGVAGSVSVLRDACDGETKFNRGDILVTHTTDKSMIPYMKQSAAIVTIEGGLTSHAAVVGLNLGIPVVLGVKDAFEVLQDGMIVTVDPVRGLIYRGRAQVK